MFHLSYLKNELVRRIGKTITISLGLAIARALINKPDIILADEPTGNLDTKTGEEISDILSKLNKENNQTIILITHSEYNRKFASRIMSIKDGKLSS